MNTSYANLGEFAQILDEYARVILRRQQRMIEALENKQPYLVMYWWYEIEDAMRRRNHYIEDRNQLLNQQ